MLVDGCLDEMADVVALAHVGLDEGCTRAMLLDKQMRIDDFFAAAVRVWMLLLDVGADDLGFFRGEQQCNGSPYARACPCTARSVVHFTQMQPTSCIVSLI